MSDYKRDCGCVMGERLICVKHCGGHAIPEPMPTAPHAESDVIRILRRRNDNLAEELETARSEVNHWQAEAYRTCDKLGCCAPVIRKDDGTRYCSDGHDSRWVERTEYLDVVKDRDRWLRRNKVLEEQLRQIRAAIAWRPGPDWKPDYE